VLRFYADFSVRDVSQLLDLPEGTVKTLSARALSLLRAVGDMQEVNDAP
jgi:DNA-directed RNA polymerase specialized sigma24 family protein